MTRSTLIVCFTLIASGCQQSSDVLPKNAMSGLTASTASSFTMTEDGSVLSILYDSFQLTYGVSSKPPTKGVYATQAGFSLRNNQAKLPLRLYLRGFTKYPNTGKGKLIVTLDSNKYDLSSKLSGEDITLCFDFTPAAESTRIDLGISLPRIVGESGLMQIDSLDLSILRSGASRDPNCFPLLEK